MVLDELTVAVSALVVLLTAPSGAVLGDVVRPTSWTVHLDCHVSYSLRI